jgi:hypothetical protein
MSATATKRSAPAAVWDFCIGVFTRNLGAKTAALILAVVVWFTVRQDLTRPLEIPARVSIPNLAAEGLMLIEAPPTTVDVTFSGPVSEIQRLSKIGTARLNLGVTKGDLLGKPRGTVEFSIDRGNLRHLEGNEIEITEIKPEKILAVIARRDRRELPVRQPKIEGDLKEWEVDGKITVTQKVMVTGPADRLAELAEVEPEPIRADRILTGNGEEERFTYEATHDLADVHRKSLIQPDGSEQIRVHVEFKRSRVTEPFELPYEIHYSQARELSLEIIPGGLVKRQPGDVFTIRLRFKGSRSDLDRIRESLAKVPPTIRAWVRAEDCDGYVKQDPDFQGYPGEVRVDMPEDLRRRVILVKPDQADIVVRTKSR